MLDPAVAILRRGVAALGLPLRSVEVELGPSQCEFTFRPLMGLDAADAMILFRSAVKQIARRNGYLASFMCRPGLPNVMSSGWHLHQSLIDRKTKRNAFAHKDGLSRWARTISPACWRMRKARPRSPRRPSTATNAIAPIRWRPTAPSGRATIAA